MNYDIKLCVHCGIIKPFEKMKKSKSGGKIYVQSICNICAGKRDRNTPEKIAQIRSRQRVDRAKNLPKYLIKGANKYDAKYGYTNDLTHEFVSELIKQKCCYCDNKDEQISLDRVDNSLGHLQSNVVPACITCNVFRGNMPYEAWLIVAKAIKRARKLGLLGEWKKTPGKGR